MYNTFFSCSYMYNSSIFIVAAVYVTFFVSHRILLKCFWDNINFKINIFLCYKKRSTHTKKSNNNSSNLMKNTRLNSNAKLHDFLRGTWFELIQHIRTHHSYFFFFICLYLSMVLYIYFLLLIFAHYKNFVNCLFLFLYDRYVCRMCYRRHWTCLNKMFVYHWMNEQLFHSLVSCNCKLY